MLYNYLFLFKNIKLKINIKKFFKNKIIKLKNIFRI